MQQRRKIALACCLVGIGVLVAVMTRRPAGESAPTSPVAEPLVRRQTVPSESSTATSSSRAQLDGAIEPHYSSTADAGTPAAAPWEVEANQPQPAAQEPFARRIASQVPSDDPPATRRLRTHRVADGDTLSYLAARYLDAKERYPEIFELNRDLLEHPDVLPIGVRLKIPSRDTGGESAGSNEWRTRMVPIAPSSLRDSQHEATHSGD